MQRILVLVSLLSLAGCIPPAEIARPELPSLRYSRNLGSQDAYQQPAPTVPVAQPLQAAPLAAPVPSAELQFVKDMPPEEKIPGNEDIVTNLGEGGGGYEAVPSRQPMRRPYQGPLHLGEPGASASLWRRAGYGSSIFRDHRAHQPMDLITIVVTENAEGMKEADTEADRDSTFLAGIAELFNFQSDIARITGDDTPATLVDATFQSEFEGEGETTRRSSLTARIAAVVVEVLPTGVMRIEGEKIISVNNEEQIMVISGLVRPRDVNTRNEVQSFNIANLRIDYFGRGTVGDVQHAGWLGRLLHNIWPF